jgi:hypothetical protein
MKVELLNPPQGNVLARGAYEGGPAYEFVLAGDGHVGFRVVGENELIWAGPDPVAFRAIVEAWTRYETEVVRLPSEEAQVARVEVLRKELESLGALPKNLPQDPEPLWSLLLFEAENGLG